MFLLFLINYFVLQAEMDALKKTQDDLQRGRHTLDDMLHKLEREQVNNKELNGESINFRID